jgi:hypothetical protein
MAHSKQVTMFISNDQTFESQNESVVDAYNALEHFNTTIGIELKYSLSTAMTNTFLPEIDSIIGALKAIKKMKEENRPALNEVLKRF